MDSQEPRKQTERVSKERVPLPGPFIQDTRVHIQLLKYGFKMIYSLMCNSINFMLTEIQVDIGIKRTNPRDATLLIHTSN